MDSLGGLPVNVEHVPHAVCIHAPDRARPPRATNLHWRARRPRSGESGPGATNERRRHLTAIRELAR